MGVLVKLNQCPVGEWCSLNLLGSFGQRPVSAGVPTQVRQARGDLVPTKILSSGVLSEVQAAWGAVGRPHWARGDGLKINQSFFKAVFVPSNHASVGSPS